MAEGPDPKTNGCQSVEDDGASQSQSTHRGNEPTLKVAMEALFDIRARWYDVGLCLEVDDGTLEAIGAQFTKPQDQLREMLRKWLKTPHATWKSLIDALRHCIVGETSLANKLEERYLSPAMRPKRKPSSIEPVTFKKQKSDGEAENGGNCDEDQKAKILAERNLSVIKGKFAFLLTNACKELQKNLKKNQIKHLHLFAISFFGPDTAIPESTELHQIFEAITRNKLWDYRTYYPLQVIVEKFGGLASTKINGWIDAYKKDLSGFQVATKIKDLFPTTGSNRTRSMSRSDKPLSPEQRDPQYVSQLSWKLDEEVADYSLDYLESLWKSFAHHSCLPPLTVLLDTVQRGCISVTWLIHCRLALQLMEKAGDLISFFQKHPFITVHIDGKCIYESQPTEQTKHNLLSEEGHIKHLPQSTATTPPAESSLRRHGKYASSRQGGYECEFVNPPPEAFQTKCPICLNILCDPQETDCCYHNFCLTCIQQVQEEGSKSCPVCKEPLTLKHNKGLQRSLNQLHVRCAHQKSGCDWVGELGELDKHLNSSPAPSNLLSGCEYNEIECEFSYAGCTTRVPRKDMTAHIGEAQLHHIELLSRQLKEKLKELKETQELNTKLRKGNQELMLKSQSLEKKLKEFTEKRDLEVEELRQALEDKEKQLSLQLQHKGTDRIADSPTDSSKLPTTKTSYNLPPQPMQVNHHFTIDNFEAKRANNTVWHSKPFFTHPQGYKIRAQVHLNGTDEGKGSHVTVSMRVMRGEYDDQLPWPFRGTIAIELLNQKGDMGHHKEVIEYDDSVPEGYADKIPSDSLRESNKGIGLDRFISHLELIPQDDPSVLYLKDDCLKFRVPKVHIDYQ